MNIKKEFTNKNEEKDKIIEILKEKMKDISIKLKTFKANLITASKNIEI